MTLATSLPLFDAAPLVAVPCPVGEILSPRLRRLLDYWQARRAGRPMPFRRDIAPEDMVDLLPRVGLIDVLSPPLRFRYRLLGSEIEHTAHGLKTGAFVDDVRPPAYRANELANYAEVAQTAEPSVHRIAFDRDGRRIRIERLILPLAVDRPDRTAMLLIGIDCPAGLLATFDTPAG